VFVVLSWAAPSLAGSDAAELAQAKEMGLSDDMNGMMEKQGYKYDGLTYLPDEKMERILTDDQSALFEAFQRSSVDDVRILLHGMNQDDVNVLKKPGQRPFVCTRGQSERENDRDLTVSVFAELNSHLHEAALAGHVEIVTALLESGSYCDNPNKDGSSPVHLAALHGKVDVLSMLLEKGDCDINREVIRFVSFL
jgi:ankyrin repeat protein